MIKRMHYHKTGACARTVNVNVKKNVSKKMAQIFFFILSIPPTKAAMRKYHG